MINTRTYSTSFDAENRTFEAIVATDSAVRMGRLTEILECSEEAVNLDRMPLPMLINHASYDVESQIGNWTEARLSDGKLILTGKLGSSDTANRIAADLAAGISFNISVGYRIESYADDEDSLTRTVSKWQPTEASLVAVPADPMCKTRSIQPSENIMTLQDQIRSLADTLGLPPSFADQDFPDIDSARAAAKEAMLADQPSNITVTRNADNENPDLVRQAQADAIAARSDGAAPKGMAQQFVNHRMSDFAKDALERAGQNTLGLSTVAIVERAMTTTSDFPILLQGEGNRTLSKGYKVAQSPLKKIARKSTAIDFREKQRIGIADFQPMQPLHEAGEVKSVSRSETKSSYKLDSYGSLHNISYEALVNDDLGAFRDWATQAGKAAAQLEASILVNLLESNPEIEGNALFSEQRDTLFIQDGSNGLWDSEHGVQALEEPRKSLRMRKGLDGVTPISAKAKYLLVHPELETAAERILTHIQAATIGDVNPFAGQLELLVEPRLKNPMDWFVFASPEELPCFEYSYLAGAEGPQIASREAFETRGMQYRVTEDFGAGCIEWRGAWKASTNV